MSTCKISHCILNVFDLLLNLMKVLFPLILLSLSLVTLAPQVWAKDVPYTLEDRDRLIRLETDVANLKEQFNQRFESIDKRFESIERRIERLEDIMMWGFGLLLTTMVGLASFVLWEMKKSKGYLKNMLPKILSFEKS